MTRRQPTQNRDCLFAEELAAGPSGAKIVFSPNDSPPFRSEQDRLFLNGSIEIYQEWSLYSCQQYVLRPSEA